MFNCIYSRIEITQNQGIIEGVKQSGLIVSIVELK